MEKRLRLCSSFAGVDCDYSDTLPITGLCSARSSDISEESFGLLRCCCLVTQSCPTLCDLVDCSPAGSSVHEDSPGKSTGVGGHSLLQGIFPTQGSNAGLPHCRQILYHLSYQGKPLGFFILFLLFNFHCSCSFIGLIFHYFKAIRWIIPSLFIHPSLWAGSASRVHLVYVSAWATGSKSK